MRPWGRASDRKYFRSRSDTIFSSSMMTSRDGRYSSCFGFSKKLEAIRKKIEAELPYFLWNLCYTFFRGVLSFSLLLELLTHSSTSLLSSFAKSFLYRARPFSFNRTPASFRQDGSTEPLLMVELLLLYEDKRVGLAMPLHRVYYLED